MTPDTITMGVQKQGRIKYLLLTLVPPLILLYLLQNLTQYGILPGSSILEMVYLCLSLLLMCYLGYLMIFRKNHQIDVCGSTIIETDFRGKESCRITTSQIASVRRNFLNELILMDNDGKKLLCVESNMTNINQFNNWLSKHNIK